MRLNVAYSQSVQHKLSFWYPPHDIRLNDCVYRHCIYLKLSKLLQNVGLTSQFIGKLRVTKGKIYWGLINNRQLKIQISFKRNIMEILYSLPSETICCLYRLIYVTYTTNRYTITPFLALSKKKIMGRANAVFSRKNVTPLAPEGFIVISSISEVSSGNER